MKWIAQFDDPEKMYSAESQPFETEDHIDEHQHAQQKAVEWLSTLNDKPYHYPYDIPSLTGEWKAFQCDMTGTLTFTRDCDNSAYLTLIWVWEPR